jgi:hypothetical protein
MKAADKTHRLSIERRISWALSDLVPPGAIKTRAAVDKNELITGRQTK